MSTINSTPGHNNTRRRLHEEWSEEETGTEAKSLIALSSSEESSHGQDDDDETEAKYDRRIWIQVYNHLPQRLQKCNQWVLLVLLPFVLLCIICICTYIGQRIYANYKGQAVHVLAPIHYLERVCPAPTYKTLAQELADNSSSLEKQTPKICLTTLTDEKEQSTAQKLLRFRNFDGLLEMTWKNKQDYANKHGYYLFDESSQLDKSRPPSWSKIKAVQRLFKEEDCDWVWWVDADTVIMNSEKKIEDFLPASSSSQDLLLSKDFKDAVNAGGWLIRNSDYGHKFLDLWWNQKEFVKPIGVSKSGDNDALKAMFRDETLISAQDKETRILIPPPCTFNPISRFEKPANMEKIDRLGTLTEQFWYMSEDFYHKGDLLSHVAGYNNKKFLINLLLDIAR